MEKVDFRKLLKNFYLPSAKHFSVIDIPPMHYLMVDGMGNPNTSQTYQDAIEALYTVAYTLKFSSKNELGKDYVVPPLEGLWWADDMSEYIKGNKDAWCWTMMIMQPEWIKSDMVSRAIASVGNKKNLPALPAIRHDALYEGKSVQIMHLGPYEQEALTLARLHDEYLPQNGWIAVGKHHEIYISDPRKTAADKLKTVLRQPVIAVKP